MEEWKEYKLGEVCKSIADGDHMPPPKVNSGIPFVTISNIVDCRLDFSNTYYVPQEYYDSLDVKRKPQQGDTIYSVVGTFGKPVYIKDNKPFVFQRHIAILRPDESKIDPQFLFYTLLSPQFYRKADVMAIGAVQRTISLTSLRNATIQVPPIDIQKGVVDALRFIDDKIEVNRRINDNLEQQAQALFKSWFVDFEPFRDQPFVESELGMIPEGWRVGRLSDIASINPQRPIKKGDTATYLDMKNMPTSGPFPLLCEIKEYTGGMRFQNQDTLMARITPCLENGKVAYVNFLEEKEIAFGSTEYIVMTTIDGLLPELLYFLCRDEEFKGYATKNMNGSSGRQRVSGETIGNYKMVLPPKSVLEAIAPFFKSVMNTIKNNGFESRRLVELRDTLLPRLMSGELSMDGLKGQSAVSPGQRPGSKATSPGQHPGA